uniref:Uncharacterized protein n=1 Tax=Setaria digitata TaxID=48799 RepID=A0A915PPD0_9BILA
MSIGTTESGKKEMNMDIEAIARNDAATKVMNLQDFKSRRKDNSDMQEKQLQQQEKKTETPEAPVMLAVMQLNNRNFGQEIPQKFRVQEGNINEPMLRIAQKLPTQADGKAAPKKLSKKTPKELLKFLAFEVKVVVDTCCTDILRNL